MAGGKNFNKIFQIWDGVMYIPKNTPTVICQIFISLNAHWSENGDLGQQFVFSRILANFDAQYGKMGVLGARESIYEKKNI